jgi:SpoVK/Ycf46/Vps4 family AAA+-type ATPase
MPSLQFRGRKGLLGIARLVQSEAKGAVNRPDSV